MIVALLNQKGGVGKTTLATHIAGELAMRGQHVVLLDADPQGSALDWTQRRSQQGLPRLFSAVGLARETLHQEAPELARRADHVVIDGPPRIAALARSALLAAERVLIPVQPALRPVGQRRDGGADPRGAGVPACAARGIRHQPARQHHGDRTRSARRSGRAAAAALRSEVRQRIVFADSVAAGRLARAGARQRRRPRNHRAGGRTAAVAIMTTKPSLGSKRAAKRVGIGAPAHESARRSVDSPR